jgi:hypothetical protein
VKREARNSAGAAAGVVLRAERQLMIMVNGYREERRKREAAEAERDELRDALRQLLTLRQAQNDGVSGQYPRFDDHERDAWKLAADLTHFEDGP